jgi:DNA (cytosine-5)-methyltransferase 1
LKPKVSIAENVKGMITGNAKGYTKSVMSRFRSAGYRAQIFLLNAADCGVPQRRERVFFVALRCDVDAGPLTLNPSCRPVGVREAVSDLSPCADGSLALNSQTDKKWWPLTRPGESYSAAVLRAGLPSKLWNHVKVDPNRPSPSVSATDMIKHWDERRLLSFAEWKRIGSFPDDYHAKTDKIGKYMVGMSVPPRMTAVVAKAVCEQWLGAHP